MQNKEILRKKRQELVYLEYIKLINSKENILVGIEVILEKVKMSLSKFIQTLMDYIKENTDDDDYSLIFDTLLEIDNPEEYLKQNHIPGDFLRENLNNYLLYKRPDILFTNKKLLHTLERLVKYNEKLWQDSLTKEKFKEESLPKIKSFVNEFLSLPYSIERFASVKKISKHFFNVNEGFYIRQLAIHDQALYKKLTENIILREQTKFENISNDITKILDLINTKNENFDSLDFYQATLYSPIEVMEVADKILDSDNLKKFQIYIGKYKHHSHTNKYTNCNIKNELLKNKFSFSLDDNLIETTLEDRTSIINYLDENFIPINSITFLDACKRFYKHELIENKEKVK